MQHRSDRHLPIVLGCAGALTNRARYVFDTLLMAAGIPVRYAPAPPTDGPWILYGRPRDMSWPLRGCCEIAHSDDAWRVLQEPGDIAHATEVDGLRVVFGSQPADVGVRFNVPFDLPANAFFFLSSWPERMARNQPG